MKVVQDDMSVGQSYERVSWSSEKYCEIWSKMHVFPVKIPFCVKYMRVWEKVIGGKCLLWDRVQPLACIYMDLRNVSCLISTSGHHWERDGSRQKPEPLDNWIRCLSSANQNAHPKHWIVFSAYTKWVVFCIVHCMMQSAMMAYINVQCILDCLPVSVSTEPVYSDDQFANSYSNPYKLIYQWVHLKRIC